MPRFAPVTRATLDSLIDYNSDRVADFPSANCSTSQQMFDVWGFPDGMSGLEQRLGALSAGRSRCAMVKRMLGAIALSVVAAVVFVPAVDAQKAPRRPQASRPADPCRGAGTQLDLTLCAATQFKKSDTALNESYRKLLADLDDEHRPLLEKTQRNWVAFRDAECELQGSHALGGSMYGMLVDDCRSGMTDARVRDLKQVRKTLADFLR